ncbi:MAG TPA: asparagine synthase (glutamine-hydrolyzing) [Candidatus Binatia bacterium]|nr:asparagine synthase (glutamine-hydrolyzing) [Candidatus Binatia bacterium]
MCGIAGILGFDGRAPAARAVLERMGEALTHRGPDEHGTWTDGDVGLTARRLRINDLVAGHQPLTNEDGTLHLVANGEIYNAEALREDLGRRGHGFASRTDTEVILHAYEEHGTACLEHLEGMFAFALWDARRRQLFLARDRFGEKPLYYVRLPHGFLFASELKALLVHPEVSRDLDWPALAHYLAFEYVPAPQAIFRQVRKLPPAHRMTLAADGRETLEAYWRLPHPWGVEPRRQQAADHALALLDAAVRRCLVCDVPWGTFLSGGLDSSLVTALAAAASSRPVKTFAIGFEEATYDERRQAAAVAGQLGTEHHEVVLRAADAPALLPEVARIFDEPFADPTVLPAVLLARHARREVTVVLSGDGGDELFCGYPTQTAHVAASAYRRLPARLRRLLTAAVERLPTSHRYLSFDFALRRFVADAARPAAERHLRWMGSFPPDALHRVLTPEVRDRLGTLDPYADAYSRLAALRPDSASDVATALDLIYYLSEDNLVQADRASMAAALEVRAPFLDRRLVEYTLGLPARVRRGLWRTKPLLRRAARAFLPPAVVRRPKHGFGVPTGAWLRGELRHLASDLLAPSRLRRQGLFDATVVSTLWERHRRGLANHRKELWTLVMFQLWATTYWGA